MGEVCEKVESVKRKQKDEREKFIYLDIGGIDNVANKIVGYKEYTWKDAPSRAQQIVYEGDVLFSTVRTYMKNIAIVDKGFYDGQIASSGFCVIRGEKAIVDSMYLFFLTISNDFIQPLNELQTGSSYPAVRDKDVFSQPIPLPPLPTQRAIVTQIEEIFSELDHGVAQLKAAQQQLKVYRQAVLKWAFEGKLTGGTKDWKLMSLKDGSSKIVVGYVGPVTQHIVDQNGVMFLSTTHIGENHFLNHDIREVSQEFHQKNKKSSVSAGDILIARHGDSGKACVVPDYVVVAQVSNAVILKPNPEIILPKFICYRINAERQRMQKMKVGGVFQVVNTKSMEAFQISVPPLPEQHRIVSEIERRLEGCAQMEAAIGRGLAQAEVLRQGVLKRAFEGGLVA